MIALALRRPVAVAVGYGALALLGFAAWRRLPIELLPDTELPRLAVTATWPGASPEAMEAQVTAPLEAQVQQVRGVQRVQSVSEEQYGAARGTISVEFARGTDMDFARLELSERLRSIAPGLPPGVSGPLIEPYVPPALREQRRPFLRYTVTGPYTVEALREQVDRLIVPELTQVEGVAAVEAEGGRARMVEIALDEHRMHALGVSPSQVRQAISALDYVAATGSVVQLGRLHVAALRHRAGSVDDIRRAVILADGRRTVRVADVGAVHDAYEEARSYYRIDGQPAVTFEVRKASGVNTLAVADRVKARLAGLAPLYPPGLRLILDEDESAAIRRQVSDLQLRSLVAAGAVFAVLLVFLRSLRATAVVFATIAFSILGTLNLVYVGGLSLNVLTLMGLAMGFGLVVDNAIVVLENIQRRLERQRPSAWERGAVFAECERGAREVVLPLLGATLTTVIVLIPFVYLQGELRAYYVPLAIVVGMALLASLVVAFTFVPAVAPRVLVPRWQSREARPAVRRWYQRLYAGFLGVTLRHPWLTLGLVAAALYGSYRLFDRYVSRGVVWRAWWGQDTYISIVIRMPRGEDLARTDEMARHFEAKLQSLPEVARFVTRVEPQYATIRVTFPDSIANTWVPVAIKEQLYAYSLLFGGTDVRVYGFGPSFYGGGGAAPNYAIKILGYNYETVRAIAYDLARRLQRFSRVRDVDPNSAGAWYTAERATEFVLALDRSRLAAYGLTTRDAVDQVAAAVAGARWGTRMRLGGETVLLAVTLRGGRQLDLLGLGNLLLTAPGGRAVRLAEVARVEEREVLQRIVREDQQYQRYVTYEFRGPPRLGDRVRDAVVAATALPPGYRIEGRQEWEWQRGEARQLGAVLAVSLVLVLMVTAALFESVRQTVAVLLTVPMALIGVFLIFFYTNASFTREAWIGVIMMGGIVVNNAILLVDHLNHLRRAEGMPLLQAAVVGTLDRVRPILMTSATTVFGLLPLVISGPSADANIWNALGLALIGGLTSSTVLVLTVTPAVYLLLERGPERRQAPDRASPERPAG